MSVNYTKRLIKQVRRKLQTLKIKTMKTEIEKLIAEIKTAYDFTEKLKNKIFSVSLEDLDELGWVLDNDSVAEAMEISIEEANQYVNETYHAEITVDENGKTFWRMVNTQKKAGGIDEGGDNEDTGDDEQTLIDLFILVEEGKVFNIVELD